MYDKIYKNFIDGEWSIPKGGELIANINPANTNDVIGKWPASPTLELDRAVEAAKNAFPTWQKTPAPERARVMMRAQRLLEERFEEIAQSLSREEGKVIGEAREECQRMLNVLEWFAGEGMRLIGQTAPSEFATTFSYTLRQPLGVCGVITPWNFPVSIPAWKIAPAIVCGNTVVMKPAEQTPETAEHVIKLFLDAGVPAGVVNMVYGYGGVIGDKLVKHPDVAAISFTGSNGIGTRIYELGAAHGQKKVLCEMGGKNPVIVMDDADIDVAVAGVAMGAFGSTGQRCTATSRAIVMKSVADEFVDKIVKKAREIKVGDPLQESTRMGPSVNEEQLSKVLKYIEIGKEEAECKVGGERVYEGGLDIGFFPAPTVFDNVTPDMRIAREEIFGPVLSVIRVESFENAIEVANDCAYGLSASIYTKDPDNIFRFINDIETGMVHVNAPTIGGEAHLPFGGVKGTGIGGREMGPTAIDFYSEEKTVFISTGKKGK